MDNNGSLCRNGTQEATIPGEYCMNTEPRYLDIINCSYKIVFRQMAYLLLKVQPHRLKTILTIATQALSLGSDILLSKKEEHCGFTCIQRFQKDKRITFRLKDCLLP